MGPFLIKWLFSVLTECNEGLWRCRRRLFSSSWPSSSRCFTSPPSIVSSGLALPCHCRVVLFVLFSFSPHPPYPPPALTSSFPSSSSTLIFLWFFSAFLKLQASLVFKKAHCADLRTWNHLYSVVGSMFDLPWCWKGKGVVGLWKKVQRLSIQLKGARFENPSWNRAASKFLVLVKRRLDEQLINIHGAAERPKLRALLYRQMD